MSVLPDPGASRAVLIGTSQYTHLEPLPAVAHNLTALFETLTGRSSWELAPEHCTVLRDPDSAEHVASVVQEAALEAPDTLLVYYTGHGLISVQDTLMLGLPNSQQQRSWTALSMDWIREAILAGQAQRQVLVLDCCYSGLALGTMGSGESSLADQAMVEGTYLLAASAERQPSRAPVGATYTAFTGALLETLWSGISEGPELLGLEGVFRHLRGTLPARGYPEPQARGRNNAGDLALGRNAAFTGRSPAAAASEVGREYRSWPVPEGIRTVEGFVQRLGQVREVAGLTQDAVSRRSGGQIAPGTVSALLTRTTLPQRWKTTGIYLSACGLPDAQVAAWQRVWEKLVQESPQQLSRGHASEIQGAAAGVPERSVWKRLWGRLPRAPGT